MQVYIMYSVGMIDFRIIPTVIVRNDVSYI